MAGKPVAVRVPVRVVVTLWTVCGLASGLASAPPPLPLPLLYIDRSVRIGSDARLRIRNAVAMQVESFGGGGRRAAGISRLAAVGLCVPAFAPRRPDDRRPLLGREYPRIPNSPRIARFNLADRSACLPCPFAALEFGAWPLQTWAESGQPEDQQQQSGGRGTTSSRCRGQWAKFCATDHAPRSRWLLLRCHASPVAWSRDSIYLRFERWLECTPSNHQSSSPSSLPLSHPSSYSSQSVFKLSLIASRSSTLMYLRVASSILRTCAATAEEVVRAVWTANS